MGSKVKSIYDLPLDPKKIKHYYVDGSFNPDTGLAAAAVLVKGWGFKPYTITKQYRGKQCSSTYAEYKAIDSAVKDAIDKGYDLTHVMIHTDQKNIVSGIGGGSSKKKEVEGLGIRLKYLPSTHSINSSSTKREINAYRVNELAKSKTVGFNNRYTMHLNKRKRNRLRAVIS